MALKSHSPYYAHKRLHIHPLELEIVPYAHSYSKAPSEPRRSLGSLKVKLCPQALDSLERIDLRFRNAASLAHTEAYLWGASGRWLGLRG